MTEEEQEKLKKNLIGRLINWKFAQAMQYYDALKEDDSYKCLEILEKIWGNNGWAGDTIFGQIIGIMVEYIRMKEGWSEKEFYGDSAKKS